MIELSPEDAMTMWIIVVGLVVLALSLLFYRHMPNIQNSDSNRDDYEGDD